jgi:hypothetical protein
MITTSVISWTFGWAYAKGYFRNNNYQKLRNLEILYALD